MSVNIEFEKVGNDKVIISLDDFEDMLDAMTFDAAMSRDEETYPQDVITKIIMNGENPVKVFRKYVGLSQAALAKKVGVSQASIVKIEQGKLDPSVKTLNAIAAALDVEIDMLID